MTITKFRQHSILVNAVRMRVQALIANNDYDKHSTKKWEPYV